MLGKNVAIYLRVGTVEQANVGFSPHQRQGLTSYAKDVLGAEDMEVFEDAGYSGANTDRPQYQQMMERIRNGEFTHLLAYDAGRISRSRNTFSKILEELKEHKVTFVSAREQHQENLSQAQDESRERIRAIISEKEDLDVRVQASLSDAMSKSAPKREG